MMMCRLLILGALFALAACDPETAPQVEVGAERLTGKYLEGGAVAAFLGVPFAEPPVGELRWRAPQALRKTVAQRRVTGFAPACMQTMRILDWYRWMAEQFGAARDYYEDLETSEDCLYLNVWTPAAEADAALPVMVWLHGGSNKSGWSYELNYHGHKLAQEGVVVVSVAYRQGVFGFFSHPEMPDHGPRANFAFWDLLASLEWIQRNIAAFGGDPGRVTLFGESSGAQNIVALMFTEHADELFHRGIAQSSAGFGVRRTSSLEHEQQRALGLASALGLPAEGSLEAMRAIPPERILDVYTQTFPDYYHSPATDGLLFHQATWKSVHTRDFRDRQLIVGSNYHEWYSSTAADTTWDDVNRQGAALLEGMDYESALEIVSDETEPRRAWDRLRTAASMLCASQHLAATMTASGNDAWVYHFTRVREDEAGNALGAYHGTEIPYAFGVHDSYMTTNETDLALEDVMQEYWVRFAATGNPNGGSAPDWPRYESPAFRVQELGNEVFPKSSPEPGLCGLFEDWDRERYDH